MSEVRLLTEADVPQAMLLKQAAAWNQTEQDWLRMLELEPEGCFGIAREGKLVATATAVCYGRELAWIGMVLTQPEFRGQGLASELMRAALEFLDSRRIEWVKLDATAMGEGLYRKFGFVEECAVERWLRPPGAAEASAVGAYEPQADLDLRAFGVDRSRVLCLLADEAASIPGAGYAMGRAGSNATFFGPCVAVHAAAAESLARWFLARRAAEPVYWDLAPENREAVEIAQSLGFVRARELVRMARQGVGAARPVRANGRLVYALAGFEFG